MKLIGATLVLLMISNALAGDLINKYKLDFKKDIL